MRSAFMSIQKGIAPIERTERLRTLNLGVLAHVDAGKHRSPSRLLYAAGVIDEIAASTPARPQTDSLALERSAGSRSSPQSCRSSSTTFIVNLMRHARHPDFIAEWSAP